LAFSNNLSTDFPCRSGILWKPPTVFQSAEPALKAFKAIIEAENDLLTFLKGTLPARKSFIGKEEREGSAHICRKNGWNLQKGKGRQTNSGPTEMVDPLQKGRFF
jgi:hypothetical protein